jgi:8-oxo-dGTP pyrophosphatase MutT (NUDIX family)
MDELRSQIQDRLDGFQSKQIEDESLCHAAVTLVIVGSKHDASIPGIFLTLRPVRLNQHSGQYALPGGKLDSGETPKQAALRELEEELGLTLGEDAILGCLDDYPTRSNFRITPVVVWAGGQCDISPSADEVDKVFHIPFSELDSEAIPVFEDGVEEDRPVLCSEFPTLGHRMYSPTASIIYQFREVAIRGNHTRVAHFDQPKFAWR